jgi:biopolymer transport protein ExbD
MTMTSPRISAGVGRFTDGAWAWDSRHGRSLKFLLHRTVQISVKISNWHCSFSVPLNNIGQIATKAGQRKELSLEQQVSQHAKEKVFIVPDESIRHGNVEVVGSIIGEVGTAKIVFATEQL